MNKIKKQQNEIMKRIFAFFILFIMLLADLNAQGIMVDAKIVDAETHEALPNASVSIDSDKSFIANADGEFCIKADSADVLTMSYVGYKTVRVRAEKVGSVIRLSPYAIELSDVNVLPLKSIIGKITSRLNAEFAKNKKQESNFYYRQTTQSNGECNEYIEAVLNGYSEIALRRPSIVAGRYGALKGTDEKKYSSLKNFHNHSCVSPYASYKRKKEQVRYPIMPGSEKLYQTDYDILTDKANGNVIYRISFTPNPKVKVPIVKCVIYVDADSYKILKYEGEILHNYVFVATKKKQFPMQSSFSVTYTYNRGFMEVQSVASKMAYSCLGISVTGKSTLVNIGKKYYNGKKKLSSHSDLLSKISSAGYDAKFWNDNTVIKRTLMEEQVVRMFEKDNVFSNMTE